MQEEENLYWITVIPFSRYSGNALANLCKRAVKPIILQATVQDGNELIKIGCINYSDLVETGKLQALILSLINDMNLCSDCASDGLYKTCKVSDDNEFKSWQDFLSGNNPNYLQEQRSKWALG